MGDLLQSSSGQWTHQKAGLFGVAPSWRAVDGQLALRVLLHQNLLPQLLHHLLLQKTTEQFGLGHVPRAACPPPPPWAPRSCAGLQTRWSGPVLVYRPGGLVLCWSTDQVVWSCGGLTCFSLSAVILAWSSWSCFFRSAF